MVSKRGFIENDVLKADFLKGKVCFSENPLLKNPLENPLLQNKKWDF